METRTIQECLLAIVSLPFLAGLGTGLLPVAVSRRLSPWLATIGVGISAILAVFVLRQLLLSHIGPINQNVYTLLSLGPFSIHLGFWLDRLAAIMMVMVTVIATLVLIYSTKYMAKDSSKPRFLAYIALFVSAMLLLILSNNFIQLFAGFELVGLMSYLLIGFWFDRASAVVANYKAFLLNRVADLGLLLGIAGVALWFQTFDFATVLANAPTAAALQVQFIPGLDWHVISVICLCLLMGAMGKSAQIPLHVWLPDSMEGPTPISALIHAATMVTAGIFLIVRLAPLFSLSQVTSHMMIAIGATTAVYAGLLGAVQWDIKRVIAYSTLSQLGYMMIALGVGAYSVAVFHLLMHAFFKALLFLSAGTVIKALDHEQDMRRMGGLRHRLPLPYLASLVGVLALVGLPPFSGFYSKDLIVEAVAAALPHLAWLGQYAYWCTLMGVLLTSYYSFRLIFLTFHGSPRCETALAMSAQPEPTSLPQVSSPSWAFIVPLLALAVPSALLGYLTVGPFLLGSPQEPWSVGAPLNATSAPGMIGEPTLFASPLAHWASHYPGPGRLAWQALTQLPFWLTIVGAGLAAWRYLWRSQLSIGSSPRTSKHARRTTVDGFDWLWESVLASASLGASRLICFLETGVVEGAILRWPVKLLQYVAAQLRRVHTGFLYHYAFAMMIGLIALLAMLIHTGAR